MTAAADVLGQAWDSGAVLAGGCLVAVAWWACVKMRRP